jgi:hypothetical protein
MNDLPTIQYKYYTIIPAICGPMRENDILDEIGTADAW